MNKPRTRLLILAALLPLLASPAFAQTTSAQPAAAQPTTAQPAATQPAANQTAAPWTQATLQAATYVVLPATLEGNAGLLSADQQKTVLDAMQRDSRNALHRRYPAATFAADPAAPGVIVVHPVWTVPGSLLPWNSFEARLELSQGASRALVQDRFGVLEVWQHQADAANYVFDRVVGKLP